MPAGDDQLKSSWRGFRSAAVMTVETRRRPTKRAPPCRAQRLEPLARLFLGLFELLLALADLLLGLALPLAQLVVGELALGLLELAFGLVAHAFHGLLLSPCVGTRHARSAWPGNAGLGLTRGAARRHARAADPGPPRLGHRPLQLPLRLLHAEGGLRARPCVPPAGRAPDLRRDRAPRAPPRRARRREDPHHGRRATRPPRRRDARRHA